MFHTLLKLFGFRNSDDETSLMNPSGGLIVETPRFKIRILPGAERGYFEHLTDDQCAGDLWFEERELIDYEGVRILPEEILEVLEAYGFDCEKIREELNE